MDTRNPYHPQWRPPHCPNPNCYFHNHLNPSWRYKRHGYYHRQAIPNRIPRFLCLHCRRSFSCQTFSPDYWLKRPDILCKLMTKACGSMANRQIARDLQVAPTTVDRQLNRLGRHCLLFFLTHTADIPPPRDVTIDGLETFELSQYHPFHFHTAVDNDSSFFWGFTDSPLRRKGRMTPWQRRRREQIEARWGRPDPQAVRKDMSELLEKLTRRAERMTIRSDEHRAYGPAISRLRCSVHRVVVSSKERRDKGNPLWEVNLLDLLIRHSVGGHKRETLCWAKRRCAAALRLWVFLVWRNWVNRRWQKRCRQTPAMVAGTCDRTLTVSAVLNERLFPTRVKGLDGRWLEYYRGEVETPAIGVNRRHGLRYAA